MGIDLTLLPLDADFPGCAFAHSVLQCERRHGLWPFIRQLKSRDVPDTFTSYLSREGGGDGRYGETLTDSYGEPVKCTTVADLLSVRRHVGVQDNPRNRAVWAYLAELPPGTKVALYWH